ncbi:MAG: M48 family metallopeptidase [Geminicoccaceae bacterium]
MVCGCGSLDRRRFLGAAAGAAVSLPLAGCDRVAGTFGWLADILVPESVAAELGRASFAEIRQRFPAVRDRSLQNAVATIGERLVAASASPWPDWEFVVFDDPLVNAFALPGGKVGVFTGMLSVTANEAQLATVLGHEIGHVNARHSAQRILAENAVGFALWAAGRALAFGDAPIPPELVSALGGALADYGVIRPFSRTQELQADRLGLRYMAHAGFRPEEAVAFWKRMAALDQNGTPAFLSTHPSSAQRIEELLESLPSVDSQQAA